MKEWKLCKTKNFNCFLDNLHKWSVAFMFGREKAWQKSNSFLMEAKNIFNWTISFCWRGCNQFCWIRNFKMSIFSVWLLRQSQYDLFAINLYYEVIIKDSAHSIKSFNQDLNLAQNQIKTEEVQKLKKVVAIILM
jgi:hypothetical protein